MKKIFFSILVIVMMLSCDAFSGDQPLKVIKPIKPVPLNTASQQSPMLAVDAVRVVPVAQPSVYTHRWEVDVRNKIQSPIDQQIIAEASQITSTDGITAGAGGSSITHLDPLEVKTISGGFKKRTDAIRIQVRVKIGSYEVGVKEANF
jgi:hypothetical protein